MVPVTTNQSHGRLSYFWNFRHRLVRYYWYTYRKCPAIPMVSRGLWKNLVSHGHHVEISAHFIQTWCCDAVTGDFHFWLSSKRRLTNGKLTGRSWEIHYKLKFLMAKSKETHGKSSVNWNIQLNGDLNGNISELNWSLICWDDRRAVAGGFPLAMFDYWRVLNWR